VEDGYSCPSGPALCEARIDRRRKRQMRVMECLAYVARSFPDRDSLGVQRLWQRVWCWIEEKHRAFAKHSRRCLPAAFEQLQSAHRHDGIPATLDHGWPICTYGVSGDGDTDNVLSTFHGLHAGQPDSFHNLHVWSHLLPLAHFLFADGTAKSLSYNLDDHVLKAMSSRSGGEVVSSLEY